MESQSAYSRPLLIRGGEFKMAASPVSTITGEVSGLGADLLTIGGVGIGIGAGVLALRKGWKVLKGFF